MAKKLYEESNISAIASAIRAKNGLSSTYSVPEMAAAIQAITPNLETLSVSANGSYSPTQGKDGFSGVIVSVPSAVMSTLEVSSNGSYSPGEGVDGFNNVVVSVPASASPVLISLSVSENSTYTPASGVDGFNEVVVNVQGGSSGDLSEFIKRLAENYGTDEDHRTNISDSMASYVGQWAFYYNKTVRIASFTNAETISDYAFGNAYIRSIDAENCITVKNYAFGSCWYLESINLPKCTGIWAGAFAECSNLHSLSFPELTTIGSGAFKSAFKNLSAGSRVSLEFPKVTTVYTSAFSSATGLKAISLPNCTRINLYAFYGCNNLSSIYAPEVLDIPGQVINYCSALTELDFPKVSQIAGYAVAFNDNLTMMSFPACMNISAQAFYNCPKLESIYLLGSSVATLSNSNAFQGTRILNSASGIYGSIFVPQSLVSDYKAANNWSMISDRIVGYSSGPEIVSFSAGTDEQIVALISAAHAGTVDLQQDAGWAVGDTRTIHINSFTAGNVTEPAQDVDIVIASFDDYMNCGCVVQFDFKDSLKYGIRMNSQVGSAGGYGSSEMKTSTLPALVNALPTWLKDLLIEFSCLASAGEGSSTIVTVTGNKLALRSEVEICGSTDMSESGEGSQIAYYTDSNTRKKKMNGTDSAWWERSPTAAGSRFCCINSTGGRSGDASTYAHGIAPFGCI